MRKLISITATTSTTSGGSSIETLYGLADDGTVWAYTINRGGSMVRVGVPGWNQLPGVPQGGITESRPQ